MTTARRRTTRLVKPQDLPPTTPSDLGGIRREAADFEAELTGYLRRRLALWALIVALLASSLWVASFVAGIAGTFTVESYLALASQKAHLVTIVVAFAVYFLVRKRAPRTLRGLAITDGVMQVVMMSCALVLYVLVYDRGAPLMSGTLAMFLLGRALFVPSTVRRTLLLSIPVPLAFLAIQLAHGYAYAWIDLPYPADGFMPIVIWDQAIFALAIALAAFASKINFELRVKAHQARVMDQYVLEELLGKGAMGEVYRARHHLLQRPTAIKMIRSDVLSPVVVERFAREVRITSQLTHPNTIRIYDYGQTPDGTFFYAMELLDGADLRQIVEKTGRLPPARVVHILVQACEALAEAHAAGLVHRDVKPGNLLLCRRGLEHDVVKVMDFGLVKSVARPSDLSGVGQIVGSPMTVAPETLRGEEATDAVDIYALGATAYFLLTGEPIFDARTSVEFSTKHLTEDPLRMAARGVDAPEDLERVVLQCLQKDPNDRPPSAIELRDALRACGHAGKWTEDDASAWWDANGDRVA